MVFSRCMRASGVAYRAKQFVESEVIDEAGVGPVQVEEGSVLQASRCAMRRTSREVTKRSSDVNCFEALPVRK